MVTQFLRFKDLQDKGIVCSWLSLRYKVRNKGFPRGRLLGPNTRAWTVDEVQAWPDNLPTESKPRSVKASAETANVAG